MPRPLLAAFQAGQQAAVPLLIGRTSNETSVALAFGLQPAALVARLGARRILVGPLYPGITDDAELGRQVVRDLVFTAFSRRIAVLQAKQAPTYRDYFDRVPQAVRASRPGAAHGDEVPWVFLWQQHDLYGVANWIEWTPRADEKVWMYEAKVIAR